jgi:cytochrome c oxidase subunit 1
MAGTIFVFFGAVHYWWPKMTGKMYHELLGQIGAIVLFIGFNLTFFTQFILGSRGMPRRYYDYTVLAEFHPEFATLHAVSSIGSYITAIGLAITAYSLITSLFNGKKAPDNPWGGASLEWKTTSRPPLENFRETPFAGDPYDFDNLVYNPQTGGYEPRKGAANAKPAH